MPLLAALSTPTIGLAHLALVRTCAAAASAHIKASKRKLSTAQLLAHAEEKERLRRARLAAPDGGGEDAQIGAPRPLCAYPSTYRLARHPQRAG